MIKEESFKEILLSSGITEPEEFLMSRVIDIYLILDTDTERLIEIFNDIADKMELPKGKLIHKKHEPYLFFDVFSDYYNDNKTRVSMALVKNGFGDAFSLSEITVSELFSISGICSDNMEEFINKIINAHMVEYSVK